LKVGVIISQKIPPTPLFTSLNETPEAEFKEFERDLNLSRGSNMVGFT